MRWGQSTPRTWLEEGNLIPRCGFRNPHLKATLATRGKGDFSEARGALASVNTFTRYPAPEGAARRWPSETGGGRWEPCGNPASYLEKLRNVPPGQVLLGVVGVHGCTARAVPWGAGGEATRAGADGVQLSLGCAQAGVPSATPGQLCRPRSRRPRVRAGPPVSSEQPLLPGHRQRERQGRGAEEDRAADATSRRLPALRSRPASPGARCSGRQSRCAGGRGARGWGHAGCSRSPVRSTAEALGSQRPGN